MEKINSKPYIIKFLEKSNILDKVKDNANNILNFKDITFEDFKNILIRVNGIIRQINKKDRGYSKDVVITNSDGFISYLPPEDKDYYLKMVFDEIKLIQNNTKILEKNKRIGTIIYYSLQNIHPFRDGNGRTGRFIFNLLKNNFSLEDLGKINLILNNDIGRNEGEKELPNPKDIRLEYSKNFFKENGIKKGIFPIFTGKTVFVNDKNIFDTNKYNKVNRIINGNLTDGEYSFKNYIAYKINEYKKSLVLLIIEDF